MEAHYFRAHRRYHCILSEGSEDLVNLGLPPVVPMSSLRATLQDLESRTTKPFVLKRSDDLAAPELVIEFAPPGSSYDSAQSVTATIGINAYGRLREQRSVRLVHSLGELLIEA